MSPEDVPNPIDFHNKAEAHDWIEQTIQKRPYRLIFFNEFVNEVSKLELHQLKVLELGSGPGMLAEQILRRCLSVRLYTLLDFSEPMLAVSRERLAEFAARLRFVRADFRDDDWITQVGTVDAVLSIQAVHEVRHKCHVPDLYEKVRSVLEPGGLMLICDHLPGENPDARRSALYMTSDEQLAALNIAGLRRRQYTLLQMEWPCTKPTHVKHRLAIIRCSRRAALDVDQQNRSRILARLAAER